jgi:hypothetical protein
VATAVWALLCTRVLVSVVPALSADRYPLLFLYYQPLFLVARAYPHPPNPLPDSQGI